MNVANLKFPIVKGLGPLHCLSVDARSEQNFDHHENNNMKKSLSEIFNEEAVGSGRSIHSLSAAGGTNDHDADQSERLKLLRRFISEKQQPCKPGGQPYSDTDLLSMPYSKMKEIFDATPNLAGNEITSSGKVKTMSASAWMTGKFELENAATTLSSRLDRSASGADSKRRLEVLREIVQSGGLPLKADGFTPYNEKELLELPVETLRLLAVNSHKASDLKLL